MSNEMPGIEGAADVRKIGGALEATNVLGILRDGGVLYEGGPLRDPATTPMAGLKSLAEKINADEAFWASVPNEVTFDVEGEVNTQSKEALRDALRSAVEKM